jgi:hypothetical protein
MQMPSPEVRPTPWRLALDLRFFMNCWVPFLKQTHTHIHNYICMYIYIYVHTHIYIIYIRIHSHVVFHTSTNAIAIGTKSIMVKLGVSLPEFVPELVFTLMLPVHTGWGPQDDSKALGSWSSCPAVAYAI